VGCRKGGASALPFRIHREKSGGAGELEDDRVAALRNRPKPQRDLTPPA
jgi:hypothetical protein